jgi:DNA-binding IclR family transcriptional regulator
VLLLFQKDQAEISIDMISSELNIPKSTAYRYAKTLTDRGFLHKTTATGTYQLGRVFLSFSRMVLASDRELITTVLPMMTTLADETGESVSLMRLINRRAVCLESIPGTHALRVSIDRGRAQLLHAGASSRVLLASQEPEMWKSHLDFPLKRYTDSTITNWDVLEENLRNIRACGYAVSDGEIDMGARAVAVPLPNLFDVTIAVLSIEAPASRLDAERTEHYVKLLQEATQQVKQSLG